MFEKILYPTDFSDVSKKAVDYTKKLKDARAKGLIVLHVIDERRIDCVSQEEMLLGSVSEKIIRRSKNPVLAIKR